MGRPPPSRLDSTAIPKARSPLDARCSLTGFREHSQGRITGSSDVTRGLLPELLVHPQRSPAPERRRPGIPRVQAGGLPSNFTTNSAWLCTPNFLKITARWFRTVLGLIYELRWRWSTPADPRRSG